MSIELHDCPDKSCIKLKYFIFQMKSRSQICEILLENEIIGDRSRPNIFAVVEKLVESLIITRELSDQTPRQILKISPKNEKRTIKTRKRQDFAQNALKLIQQTEDLLINDQVSEIIFALGANYANPKEIWRFQIGQPLTTQTTQNKFKAWKLARSIKPEIFESKKFRGKLHLLAKLRHSGHEIPENFIPLPFEDYSLKGKKQFFYNHLVKLSYLIF